jgi:hypothetical protein
VKASSYQKEVGTGNVKVHLEEVCRYWRGTGIKELKGN